MFTMRSAWINLLLSGFFVGLQKRICATSVCGNMTSTAVSGNITSPGYPERYPGNIACEWIIEAPSNKVIAITFYVFSIETHKLCKYDSLAVYNGDELYTGRKLCGQVSPHNFISSSNTVRVVFRSDNDREEEGFWLSWNSVDQCPRDEYTCWDGQCIPLVNKCDGNKNCANGDDEIECAHVSSDLEQCGKTNVPIEFTWDPRIVGGNAAVKDSYPWVGMLYRMNNDEQFLCGVSVINHHNLLTAAHCFEDRQPLPFSYIVYVGRYSTSGNDGEQRLPVSKITVHPNFTGQSDQGYDLAIITLERPINYTSIVKPVCLPMPGQLQLENGMICIAVGWGVLAYDGEPPDRLFQVRLPIANKDICASNYAMNRVTLLDSQLCAGDITKGGVDACQGDSGGPLLCLAGETWFQVGITSFAVDCADPKFPGVFTDVASFYNWIQENSSGAWQPHQQSLFSWFRFLIVVISITHLLF